MTTKTFYGTWNGDYAVWGGMAAKVTDKATVNAQVGYEDAGKIAAALNVVYKLFRASISRRKSTTPS